MDTPTTDTANYELAVAEAEQGHWDAAERYARAAVTLGGDRYAGCLGQILTCTAKYSEARMWLLRALDLHADDPDVLFCLGAISLDLGTRKDALTYFDRALVLRPNFPRAQRARDRVLWEEGFFATVAETLRRFVGSKGLVASDPFTLGDIEFPSASLDAHGGARFSMRLPTSLILTDLGAANLFYHEVGGRGYEHSLRRFIDLHLASDDVFLDVGAHWGIHSLTAATLRRREVSVVAVEAHPQNAARLDDWVKHNQLQDDIEIIPSAIADAEGVGRMTLDGSSMGHTLRKSNMGASSNAIEIDTTTLDRVMEDRPHLHYRRIILKLDVEGCELEAITGARQLFSSGAVEAVIWEKALFDDRQVQEPRNQAVLEFLASRGFEHFYFPPDRSGALIPLKESDAPCNVYSLARGFERKERYL